jgi:hypothetical protein
LPPDATSLARSVADLRRQLNEILAARRLAAAAAAQPWQALPLANEWTPAAGWQPPQFHREIGGAVQLRGTAAPGTLAEGVVIAVLPAEVAPLVRLEVGRVGGGSATAAADLYALPDGTITAQNLTGTITRLSLTGMRIPL